MTVQGIYLTLLRDVGVKNQPLDLHFRKFIISWNHFIDKPFDGSLTSSLQKISIWSLRSSNSRNINRGGFNRNSLLSCSHNRSFHSPHSSSSQSLDSSRHRALSLRSHDNLSPPSNIFFSYSMNSHIPLVRSS